MMYNPQLDTFIAVADAGSFNKAADRLYISANAVMKQINLLERDLNFPLFERTHRGLKLTPAGESLYQDAKYIIEYSKSAILRAANKTNTQQILKIGVSFTTPVHYLLSLWDKIQNDVSNLKFELVSFENTPNNAREIMRNFGKNIDVVAGIYSLNLLKERNCMALHLYDSPLCLAVPIRHRLADKEKIKIEDLSDETVLILKRYYLDDFDKVRADILKNYSKIHIEDISFFNVQVFNQCANENKLMLAIQEWEHIHPMLKFIPVEWNYSIPFGIMYSPQPSQYVELFINAVKNLYQ